MQSTETLSTQKTGSTSAFDENWKTRKEALYNHWTRDEPANQIQLAFRSHWILFNEFLAGKTGRDCLEVGCGRGSLSSYFAQHGYRCTLLDYSQAVLDVAKGVFANNGHPATFVQGDANSLPFPDQSFDVVFSIGLLEHFEKIEPLLREQVRILRPGGVFFGYIVPERPDNVQKYFRWVNAILRGWAKIAGWEKKSAQKSEIFRSDFGSERYLEVMRKLPVKSLQSMGNYPLPMISHSPEFPFSLLPPAWEKVLTGIFRKALSARRKIYGRNPWICREEMGQAFLVVAEKI